MGEAGAACAKQRNRHRLHHARSLSHIPPRSSHHGSGAELVVSAHRPQSANLHRHSLRQAGGLQEGHRNGLPSEGRSLGLRCVGAAATITAGRQTALSNREDTMTVRARSARLISALLFATVAPMCAEEGMWTFEKKNTKKR